MGEDDPDDPRVAVLLDLLARVASKPAFHELRTRQRLGYMVSLAKHRLGGVMGLAVRVQSPDRRPGLLRRRVSEWLAAFGAELRGGGPGAGAGGGPGEGAGEGAGAVAPRGR